MVRHLWLLHRTIQRSAFRRVRNAALVWALITTHQPACVRGRLQDHGIMAIRIHPMSGIEVVVLLVVQMEFLIITLRRTSQGVSRKHLSTVCVKSIAAKISLIRLLTTSEWCHTGTFLRWLTWMVRLKIRDPSTPIYLAGTFQAWRPWKWCSKEHWILLKNFLVGASVLPRAQPTCSLVRQHFRQRTRARAQTTGLRTRASYEGRNTAWVPHIVKEVWGVLQE